MEIVAGEAKEVVKATLLQLHPAKVGYTVATIQKFTNLNVRRKLSELCANTAELNHLLEKENVHTLKRGVYLECKHRLGELIYGTDMIGKNAYVQLKMTMQKCVRIPKEESKLSPQNASIPILLTRNGLGGRSIGTGPKGSSNGTQIASESSGCYIR